MEPGKVRPKVLENEQRYQLLIENIPTVAWISNQEGETIFISENVDKVFGYSSEEIVAGGDDIWFGRVHPEDRKRVRNEFTLLFSEGRDFKVEYRIQRSDGAWIWIYDRANVVEEIDGEQYAYGVFSDITESKLAEEALQLYTDRLKILYQINQGILIAQSPQEIARVALRWVRQLIPCFKAGITLFDRKTNQIEIIAVDADGKTGVKVGTRIEYNQIEDIEMLAGQLPKGQILYYEVKEKGGIFDVLADEGTKALVFAPLIYEGELIGSLNLAWEKPNTLTQLQDEIVREVAAQLSIAIRQTQLRENEQRRRKELELLEHVSTALRFAAKLDDLYIILMDEFKALFRADAGAILISTNNRVEIAFVDGPNKLKELLFNKSEIVDGFTQSHFLSCSRFLSDQGFDLQDIASTAILSFKSREDVLGGAVLFWREHHEFSEENRRLLNTVADVAGIALHRMKVLETLEQRVDKRTRALSALYDVTSVSSSSLDLQEILDRSLKRVLLAMVCDIGIILLIDEIRGNLRMASCQGVDTGIVEQIISLPGEYKLAEDVLKDNKALVVPDLSCDPRSPDLGRQMAGIPYASVPIHAKSRSLGVLAVVGKVRETFNEEAVSLLRSIADQIGIAIENAQLYDQAQQVAVLTERQRLARDLHDSVTQSLYSLNLMAGTGHRLMENGSEREQIAHTFKRLELTAHQALKEMRLLLYELRPAALEQEGLVGALQQRLDAVEGRVQIKANLIVEDIIELTPGIEEQLYLIAQEALNNALKYAESSQLKVSLRVINDQFEMEICDNGVGFDVKTKQDRRGMGMRSMEERARIIGGQLKIKSEPGRGTCIQVRVKVK